MKSKIVGVIVLSLAATAFAVDTQAPALIPLPQEIQRLDGSFMLRKRTRIYTDAGSVETGDFLAQRLRRSTGYPLKLSRTSRAKPIKHGILLTTQNANPNLGSEGYELTVTKTGVVIRAPTQAGLFYGVQTLLQLLPPEIFGATRAANVDWRMPCVQIKDWPRFRWRGLMLDVSRHFFNKAQVETVLDAMALYKLNTFHWHLVDNDGWRIEIKKYPRLTQIGAWRNDIGFGLDPESSTAYGPDMRYGGFYTQADIREVVPYAKKRHITVVPEIEMPGHCAAALACYPELSCFGGPYSMDRSGKNHSGVFCAGNDEVFTFLENVLSEVFNLFPSQYIHIGGDEVDKKNWEHCPKCQARIRNEGLKNAEQLQSYFVKRIEKFINAHGRTLVGWSEIREGGLAPSAVVMDWIGGATEAATEGHDVVMSPTKYCYLDYYQSTNHTTEPRAIGGFLPLNKVYSFEPIPADLPAQFQAHILGAQGNLWTEYVASLSHAEYMIFPRECAIAEVTWSSKESRDWNDFMRRLRLDARRLDELGINYRVASLSAAEK
jgi:hexosaminidase